MKVHDICGDQQAFWFTHSLRHMRSRKKLENYSRIIMQNHTKEFDLFTLGDMKVT